MRMWKKLTFLALGIEMTEGRKDVDLRRRITLIRVSRDAKPEHGMASYLSLLNKSLREKSDATFRRRVDDKTMSYLGTSNLREEH